MIGKKGIGVGQVFVFMIAAITFSLIMIFGYKIIAGFLKSGEEVQFVQFKTDLELSIKRIHTEYGAVRIEKFYLPAGYSQICFVDMGANGIGNLCDENPVACDAWQGVQGNGNADEKYENADQNVFLAPSAPIKIKVSKIQMDSGYLCPPVSNGLFSLRLEGKGSYTYLSLPS